ncbi:MAG: GNAT family N-acetyltransferase [Geminicoccaceae bacterium]
MSLISESLGRQHDRAAFSCGVAELDDYLKRRAGQDVRRRIARVFVGTEDGSNVVLGFYTLSALSIDVSSLPEDQARKLPRHPVPAALIGRLAVDQSAQGRGLGRLLLADAIQRTLGASEQVAIHAMVVDAKDEAAQRFYQAHGFLALPDQPMRLFLPLRSVPT